MCSHRYSKVGSDWVIHYLLFIPSVILFYMVFINICQYKFSIIKSVAIVFTIYLTLISILIVFNAAFPAIGLDSPGNLIITGCLMILAYIKNGNKLLSAYYALFTSVVTIFGNILVTSFTMFALNIHVEEIRDSLLLYFIVLPLTFILCYVFSKYMGNRLHQCYIRLSPEIRQKFATYGLIISTLTFVLSHYIFFVPSIIDIRTHISTISTMLIASIFFVAMLMMFEYSLSQQREVETEYSNKAQADLENYTRYLENAYTDMRTFRHDHLNLLYALVGYTEKDSSEDLKEYLKQNIDLAQNAVNEMAAAMDSLRFIHIPELKGLLSVKLAQAQGRGIEVELDITNPIDDISLSRVNLCRLAGIIVDNAIDELLAEEYENKVLKFGIIPDGDDILIICSNTCKSIPPIEKIFEKGYSTRGKNRGLGLSNLKHICEENKNVLPAVHIENGYFTLIVTVRRI